MAEYIEREATIEKLNKLCDRVCQYSKAQRKYMCGACPLGDAFTVIEDDIPAADVRPVVRGEWYWDKDGMDWGIGSWRCSECHARPETWWQGDSANPRNKSGHYFCPNCGAKMEG